MSNIRDDQIDGLLLNELVTEWARRYPTAAAVVSPTETVTYQELDLRVRRWARLLTQHGVRPRHLVAVLLERTVDWVAIQLAILSIGAACVPQDTTAPPARHRFVLADTSPALLVTRRGFTIPDVSTPVLLVEDGAGDEIRSTPPPPPVTDEDTAFVYYTSGSTGNPKGVLLRRGSVRAWLADEQAMIGIRPGDRVLVASSPAFDGALWQLGLVFGAGATGVLHAEDGDLAQALRENSITVFSAPPSVHANIDYTGLPALHTVITAAEACPPRLAAELAPRLRLINAYGPTETTVISTVHTIATDEPLPLIGLPLARTSAHVLDHELNASPIGAAGELYIGGTGVAAGYHNRPALTAERFVPDPFTTIPGARLYRTGDSVRRTAGGPLDFLGRIDRQLNIHGLRIEPGEIESVLGRHPAVREALVTGWDEGTSQRLVAYVTPNGTDDVPLDQVRRFLGEELPPAMVPGAFVVLPRFPLTINRKIDRAALPPPGAGTRRRSAPPDGHREQILAGVWQEVLGIELVGRDDNFLDLGGDSVLAVRVVTHARRERLAISVEDVFRAGTLADLAAAATSAPAVVPPANPAGGAVAEDVKLKLIRALGQRP